MPTPPAKFSPSTPDDAVQRYMRQARAANTRRTYTCQWQKFVTWCIRNKQEPLPALTETIAAYLATQASSGRSVNTLRVALAAIHFAHRAAGVSHDREHPTLRLLLEGIRRNHMRPQRQAEPLTGILLREILETSAVSPMDVRDRALLSLLYLFALRSSEVVALDWQAPGCGQGWLKIMPDRAEIGLLTSKASQGRPETVVIPTRPNPLAIGAIHAWIACACPQPGTPLLRPVSQAATLGPRRLHPGSVSRLVKGALARHYLRTGMSVIEAWTLAGRFSGHSGRVGMCVAAAEAGVAPQHIAALARHRSLTMVRHYAKAAEMLKCAPHHLPGVGV